MRVLLLHPEDEFAERLKGRRWDWIVDLGRAPQSFCDEWSRTLGCKVSSIYDFALEIEDVQVWRDLFAAGMGRVIDSFGIDWWDVVSLSLHAELQDIRLARRLAESLGKNCSLTASRPSLLARAVQVHLGVPLQTDQSGLCTRLRNRILHCGTAVRNLSFTQVRQVAHDKYDPHYRWRRKLAPSVAPSSRPVILLPTAYSNVTKTALNYARLLPDQEFLLVVARESGSPSQVPANVQVASLAPFAGAPGDKSEMRDLERRWIRLEQALHEHPEFGLAVRLGAINQGLRFLRRGVSIRNAWNRVFETQSVVGCLSADDTNPYTRIPLILAARRRIPGVACHHGALDFRMAFKVPEFFTYIAQGEMERDYLENICRLDARRIRVGAASGSPGTRSLWRDNAPWIVFFTEPYETDAWRAGAIYREVLPRLCAVARQAGKSVVIKLHPFETAAQRKSMVNAALDEQDRKLVSIMTPPMSGELLRDTWCAVTVESTVACECAMAGIPAFLCGWLRHAYSAYALQYARFGAGIILEMPDDLLRVPEMIHEAMPSPNVAAHLSRPITVEALAECLLQPVEPPFARATGSERTRMPA